MASKITLGGSPLFTDVYVYPVFPPSSLSLNSLPLTTCKTMQSKIRSNIFDILFRGQFRVVCLNGKRILRTKNRSYFQSDFFEH